MTMFRPTVEAGRGRARPDPGWAWANQTLVPTARVRSLKGLPLEDPRGQRIVPDPDKAFNAILGRSAY